MRRLTTLIITLVSFLFLKYSYSDWNSRVKYFRSEEQANETKFYAIDFIGLIESHGRQAEWHNVTTEDGYVLSLFRIPPNPSVNNSNNNRPIFLQHELMAAADIFIIFGNGRSLPYLLSDAGYDVWLGNLRGNYYSRRHNTLSPDDSEFWDFGMDEHALQDLPAFFNYILVRTNQPTLSYVGHSLGTTLILILLSDKPEYNSKLNLAVLMAPITYWRGWNLTRYLLAIITYIVDGIYPESKGEFLVHTNFIPAAMDLCISMRIMSSICRLPFELLVGEDAEQFDEDTIMTMLYYWPSGGSVRTALQYGQNLLSGEFRHFDFKNKNMNLDKYGDATPPEYNLTNVQTPLIIFRGKNDLMSTEEMNEEFLKRLPHDLDVTYEVIEYDKFNHQDFVTAKDVEKLLYNNLLTHLEQFLNKKKIKTN